MNPIAADRLDAARRVAKDLVESCLRHVLRRLARVAGLVVVLRRAEVVGWGSIIERGTHALVWCGPALGSSPSVRIARGKKAPLTPLAHSGQQLPPAPCWIGAWCVAGDACTLGKGANATRRRRCRLALLCNQRQRHRRWRGLLCDAVPSSGLTISLKVRVTFRHRCLDGVGCFARAACNATSSRSDHLVSLGGAAAAFLSCVGVPSRMFLSSFFAAGI